MEKVATLAGRILLGHIFLLTGITKISAYAGTVGYMASMGVPGALLPLVIALEIAGGLALIIGWKTRWAAGALAAFTILAAAIFHNNFADQMQMLMFMKNLAISGGLLFIAAYGAGPVSLDARQSGATPSGSATPVLNS